MNSDVDDDELGFGLGSNPQGKNSDEKYGTRRKLELEPGEVTELNKMGKKKKEYGDSQDGEGEEDVDMSGEQHSKAQTHTHYSTKDMTLTQTQAVTDSHTQSKTEHGTKKGNGKGKSGTKQDLNKNWERNTTHTTFFIERIKKEDRPIHPMEMAKILHQVEIKDYKELKSAGQGRFRITFNKPRDAEKLINSRLLKEEFRFNIFIPTMLKQTIGVARDVPPSLTDEEIMENIQAGKKKITKVERIKRMVDGKLKPTYTVKIYVDGQELPDEVAIFGIMAKVDYYIFPVKLCNHCWRYGHKAKACKCSKSRCVQCGLEHDENPCWARPHCLHCSGPHRANDKNCSERIRQEKILQLMATERLTFVEALKKLPRPDKLQSRLQSSQDFPLLPGPSNTDTNNRQHTQVQQNHVRQKQPLTQQEQQELTPNTIVPVTDIQRIVNHVKEKLLEQLNLGTIMEKIKMMQETINKHIEQQVNKGISDTQPILNEIIQLNRLKV